MVFKKGYKHSQETKDKLSNIHKKRFQDNPQLSILRMEQTKRLIREGKIIPLKKGHKMSKETIDKISKGVSKSLIGHKRNLGKHHSNKTKEILRKKAKEQWKNGMSQIMKEQISKKLKGRKLSEETITKYRNKIFTKEHRNNLSLANKGRLSPMLGKNHSQETKRKMKEARKNIISPKKDTTIEVKIQNFLKELNIEFYPHQYMKEIEHSYQADIFIPSLNLIIECDGDYWHNFPFGNEIDKVRTKELQDKGFKILRLWEHEIRKMDLIEFKERISVVKI